MLDGFQRRGLSTSFLKPVGQRTVIEDGVPADEDAVLMKQVFGLREPLRQMSPVHIPRGFTQAYIEGDVVEDLPARIRAAHAAFADRDILLIEGTGHAGVGAVIGLSNATVAAMLGAPAVIVSEGGVGRPIDEIVLNASLFERHGVQRRRGDREQGRPRRQARAGADARARPGPPRHPVARRAAVPPDPVEPDARDGPRGRPRRDDPPGPRPRRGHRRASRSARWSRSTCSSGSGRGAWSSSPATGSTSSGRSSTRAADGSDGGDGALGLVLTGGYRPNAAVLEAIRAADLFATLVPEDTYQVASELHDLLVKTHPADAGKIAEIKALLWEYLFIDRVLEVADEAFVA